jgi:hypothetical protein
MKNATPPAPKTDAIREKFAATREELGEALIERDDEIDLVLTALLAREHLLLVGPPGCGKSLLLDGILSWMRGTKFNVLPPGRSWSPRHSTLGSRGRAAAPGSLAYISRLVRPSAYLAVHHTTNSNQEDHHASPPERRRQPQARPRKLLLGGGHLRFRNRTRNRAA